MRLHRYNMRTSSGRSARVDEIETNQTFSNSVIATLTALLACWLTSVDELQTRHVDRCWITPGGGNGVLHASKDTSRMRMGAHKSPSIVKMGNASVPVEPPAGYS